MIMNIQVNNPEFQPMSIGADLDLIKSDDKGEYVEVQCNSTVDPSKNGIYKLYVDSKV